MSNKKLFITEVLLVLAISFLFYLLFSGKVRGQSIDIKSGVVVNEQEQRIDVGPGTYIPEPANKELAKRIVDLNTSIESLKTRLDDSNEKIVILTTGAANIEKTYQDRIDDLEIENAVLRGWWSRWGRTAVWCAVAAGAGFIVGYEVHKLTEK